MITEATCRKCGTIYQTKERAFCGEHGLCVSKCCGVQHSSFVGRGLREDYDDVGHPFLFETNDPWAPGGSDRHYFVSFNPDSTRETRFEVPAEIHDYIAALKSMIERAVK